MLVPCQKASRSRINVGLITGLLLYLASSTAFSQAQRPPMQKFEDNAPQVGEQLPDLVVHDDLGNPVNIRDLADENYKVLVLGCLT